MATDSPTCLAGFSTHRQSFACKPMHGIIAELMALRKVCAKFDADLKVAAICAKGGAA